MVYPCLSSNCPLEIATLWVSPIFSHPTLCINPESSFATGILHIPGCFSMMPILTTLTMLKRTAHTKNKQCLLSIVLPDFWREGNPSYILKSWITLHQTQLKSPPFTHWFDHKKSLQCPQPAETQPPLHWRDGRCRSWRPVPSVTRDMINEGFLAGLNKNEIMMDLSIGLVTVSPHSPMLTYWDILDGQDPAPVCN